MHPAHQHALSDDALSTSPEATPIPAPGRTSLPIVAVEVLGPEEINEGGVASYAIVVANLGEVVVDHVRIHATLPTEADVAEMSPAPIERDGFIACFEVGRLAPKSRRRIQIELIARQRGAMTIHAEAVFSAVAQGTTRVCRPELTIDVDGPTAVVIGDAATFKVVIENRGDGPAENVTVSQSSSDDPDAISGLAHLGRLAPGQSREIYLSSVIPDAGRFLTQFRAVAWGGFEAEAEAEVRVAQPMLAVELGGPRVCAVQSSEVFTLVLANPGDAPAANIEAVAAIPVGLQVQAFDRPVQFDAGRRIVRWRLPALPPGGRELLRLKAVAAHPDRFALRVAAAGDNGLRAEAEHLCEAAAPYARRSA